MPGERGMVWEPGRHVRTERRAQGTGEEEGRGERPDAHEGVHRPGPPAEHGDHDDEDDADEVEGHAGRLPPNQRSRSFWASSGSTHR